jgi:hypothetical protein
MTLALSAGGAFLGAMLVIVVAVSVARRRRRARDPDIEAGVGVPLLAMSPERGERPPNPATPDLTHPPWSDRRLEPPLLHLQPPLLHPTSPHPPWSARRLEPPQPLIFGYPNGDIVHLEPAISFFF